MLIHHKEGSVLDLQGKSLHPDPWKKFRYFFESGFATLEKKYGDQLFVKVIFSSS